MKIHKPEIFFVIVLLFFGILLVFITPIGAGADEDTHIGRIWEMSKGVLIPNQYLSTGPYYPFVFYTISYRQDVNLSPVTWEKFKSQLMTKIDWDNMINHTTRARYFPTLYLPQALIMGIMGRVLDFPVGIIYYTERLSYLFLYALIVYLAIRMIPIGKWILGILSITPMALIQASSISPDSVNNGIAYIFLAWALYLNTSEKCTSFSRRDWVITAGLTLFVCTLKLNAIPLLLILFLIPRIKFGSTKWLVGFVIASLFSFVIISLGWNYLTSSFLIYSSTSETYNVLDQLKGIVSEPLRFLRAIINAVQTQSPGYIHDWIGISGYDYWDLPTPVYWITPILILLAILSESAGDILRLRKRIIAIGTFLVVFLGTLVLFYLLYNPPGTILIPGVQGRYFLFISPVLMIALIPRKAILRLNRIWLRIGLVFVALLTVGGLFLAYHVTCGSSFYSSGLCYLPRVKNWSPETSLQYHVNDNNVGLQTFTARCGNLSRIRLWIRSKGVMAKPISVKLIDSSESSIVYSSLIPQNIIPTNEWLDITIPPIGNSKDKSYSIEISTAEGINKSDIILAYTTRNEYLEGEFSINREKQDGDLLFLYGCSAGLNTFFLPISR